MKCKNCIHFDRQGWCEKAIDSPEPNREKGCYYFQQMTNADRIRQMSDEELADEVLRWFNWLNAVEWDDSRILEWLKKEVNE